MNQSSKGSGVAATENGVTVNHPHVIFIGAIQALERGAKVAIFTQDNPDPDAIGSAFGLSYLIKRTEPSLSVTVYYGATISHPQNRTLVNLLNLPLKRVDSSAEYDEYALKIFVDVASSGKKNLQSAFIKPDIIIDHHEDDPEGDFILKDIRPVGATCTIICDYLLKAGYDLSTESEDDVKVATALFFGIENDTSNLVSENTRQLDIECFLYLLKRADINQIVSIRNYPIPRYFFELEETANKNKAIEGSVLVTGLEFLKPERRDGLPYISDKFVRMEGIETVVVFGIIDDCLAASLRTTNKSISLNSLCHSIFGEEYSGAKSGAGGARVPLGLIAPKNAADNVRQLVWEALRTKLTAEIFDKISGQ